MNGPAPSASKAVAGKPVVRVIHMMARSGGTIIAKCLGVMPGVAMLSEVHPAVTTLMTLAPTRKNRNALPLLWAFDPLRQADQWFGLLTREDKDRIRAARTPLGFADAIDMIRRRADAAQRPLILRDWSHLDFLGEPFTSDPPGRFAVVDALDQRFELVRCATVRHPIDQWLSMRNLPMLREEIALEAYLRGCRRFAEQTTSLSPVKFEDFARDPASRLRTLCDRLRITFDPMFTQRWASYRTITGDVAGSRAQERIEPPERRPVRSDLLTRFEANEDYQATLRMLGYSHPGP